MTAIEQPPDRFGNIWHEVTCKQCGEVGLNTYMEPTKTQMKERELCFACNLWTNRAKGLANATIIGHQVYSPGNGSKGGRFNGMAGRRFDISYISGPHKGKVITTYDLWSAGELPEWLWEQFPANAEFLGGASFSGLAWNPSSDRQQAEHPRPEAAGIASWATE